MVKDPDSTTNKPLGRVPFGVSTCPVCICRRIPWEASQVSSSRGTAPTVLCRASRSAELFAGIVGYLG